MNSTALLIYDGDCAFCKNCLRIAIERLPLMPRYAAFQRLNLAEFGLSTGDAQTQVWVIDEGKKLGGHKAVAWIFSQQKSLFWRFLGWLILVGSPVSAYVYRWVAKNRHKLPGGTKECSIEDRP
jgi:predicted DCC family thiol-disulfide oxidoreductase YuxK